MSERRVAESPSCPWRENVSLELLGSLSESDARELERHLDSGCAECEAEREAVSATLAGMDLASLAASSAAPSPEVRKLLLHRVAAQQMSAPRPRPVPAETPASTEAPDARVWRQWSSVPASGSSVPTNVAEPSSGLSTVLGSSEGWQTSGYSGVDVKPLFVDPVRRYVTMLIRMGPGSSYPGHRHAGHEECFVVQGELRVGERVLRAGDYQIAREDSVHGVQSTEKGCVLFIVSSQDDELV